MPIRKSKRQKSAFHSLPSHGIPRPEMFAVKSMDANSNLLRLKLDMVYRDLPLEEAQARFTKVTTVDDAPKEEEKPPAPATRVVKRKVVKVLKGKS